MFDKWNCNIAEGFVLELPDRDNKNSISRIDEGTYKCVKRKSRRFKNHFHVLNVKNRSYILIHSGNYNTHTKGCLLVGDSLSDINSDGELDVVNSKKTMNLLNNLLTEEFLLVLKNQFDG